MRGRRRRRRWRRAARVRVACAAATSGRVLAALVPVLVLQVPCPGAQRLAVLAVRRRAAAQSAWPRRSRSAIRDRGVIARFQGVWGAAAWQIAAAIAAVPARAFWILSTWLRGRAHREWGEMEWCWVLWLILNWMRRFQPRKGAAVKIVNIQVLPYFFFRNLWK